MHNIEYEGMHMICFCCGKYGHDKDQCTQKTEVAPNLIIAAQPTGEKENQATGSGTIHITEKEMEGCFGPWMEGCIGP